MKTKIEKMETKTCISCGMPLRTNDDHALKDPAKTHCRHCSDARGNLKSYDAVLSGMTDFLTRTQGLDPKVAQEAAKGMLATQPAWSKR